MLMHRAAGVAVALVLAAAPVAVADTAPPVTPAPSFSIPSGPTLAPTNSPTASASPTPTKSELAQTGAREDTIGWMGAAAVVVLLAGAGMTGTSLYWYSGGKARRPAYQRRSH